MAIDSSPFDVWAPRALTLLRIVVGYLFLQHATAKLFGVPHVAFFDHLQLMSMLGAAGMIEFVGGILLILGIFVRPAAFILSGEMAFAYFIGHASRGHALLPTMNNGEAAVLLCFACLFMAAAGGGSWGVDAWRRRAVAA